MNLKDKSNWTNKDISYLKNISINEYDLKSGGLSVIKENHLLKQEYIDKLDSMEKEKRNIIIGKLQAKNKSLTTNMVIGFGDARERFAKLNNIKDDEILSIKKDALFLINRAPRTIVTKISDNLTFVLKNSYSSYIMLNNKEFYFSSISKQLDIKGLSDESKDNQKKYLLNDIAKILSMAEKIDRETLYKNLKKYRSYYLNKKLPLDTYRNIDSNLFTIDGGYELDTIDDSFKETVDISYNYVFYILPLIKILLNNR